MSRLDAHRAPGRPAGSLRAALLLVGLAAVLGVAVSAGVVFAAAGLWSLLGSLL